MDDSLGDFNTISSEWSREAKNKTKKVLVLNGSPHRETSCTMRVTNAFLNGLSNGIPCEIEKINITDLHIKPCMGCLSCWGRTEGTCVIKDDDIPMLKQKIMDADIIIESYPLYFFGMPGVVKVMTDRLLGMMCTYRGQKPTVGESFHGIRDNMEGKRFLIISTCGYAQTDLIYDSLLAQYDCICGVGHYTALLCPQGKTFSVPELSSRIEVYLEKYVKAGEEFAMTGALSEETKTDLSIPPFREGTFKLLLAKFWEDEKEAAIKK